MNDPCCEKRQREVKVDGREMTRCVNPKAKAHLSIVNNDLCSLCPVRQPCKTSTIPKNHLPMPLLSGYPYCEHRLYKANEAVCGVTGLPVTPEQCNRCDEETRDRVAKLGDKLSGYASAIKRWVAAGRPTRSEEEQKRIREEHCLPCEMYDKGKDACKNCGCSLAMTGNPLTSKLAMGTEKCPLGRWE